MLNKEGLWQLLKGSGCHSIPKSHVCDVRAWHQAHDYTVTVSYGHEIMISDIPCQLPINDSNLNWILRSMEVPEGVGTTLGGPAQATRPTGMQKAVTALSLSLLPAPQDLGCFSQLQGPAVHITCSTCRQASLQKNGEWSSFVSSRRKIVEDEQGTTVPVKCRAVGAIGGWQNGAGMAGCEQQQH